MIAHFDVNSDGRSSNVSGSKAAAAVQELVAILVILVEMGRDKFALNLSCHNILSGILSTVSASKVTDGYV